MKLILNTGAPGDFVTINLPNDLLWTNEFSWVATAQTNTYTLPGTLIIELATKQIGRPINLEGPSDMGWVSRATLLQLIAVGKLLGRKFTLTLEYPTDTRTFLVMFDSSSGEPITATPVTGFPGHSTGDWFTLKLKLIEVD